MKRRDFIKSASAGAIATIVTANKMLSAPLVLAGRRSISATGAGELIFRPIAVQNGIGPHLLDWAYASDENWDAFHANIGVVREGVKISDTEGKRKFGINVRWNVEGFGYTYLTADNGGEFYELPPVGKIQTFNLNFELANSRIVRNRKRIKNFIKDGWRPSFELQGFFDLSKNLLGDAKKFGIGEETSGRLCQQALFYALRAGEMMEQEKARWDLTRLGQRPDFRFGGDVRHYFNMPSDLFMALFTEVFDFANLGFVVNGDAYLNIFEPEEGVLNFKLRDVLFKHLRQHQIAVGGRMLFWFHHWVTPDWLKAKSFDAMKRYVERHARQVIGHYGADMYFWEIVNELHDWANEAQLTPEQAVELTKFACEVAKDTAPQVQRLINNCCPFAEYVQLKKWSGQDAKYRQRTPWQFTRDLIDAGADFNIIGQQMYFPYRDLQDIILFLERYRSFGKKVQITEIGVTSGPNEACIKDGSMKFPTEPYAWHRPWDEELQADWLEQLYTLLYSKPWIEAASWFDFVDTNTYIDTGGLVRSPKGERKPAFERLKKLRKQLKTGHR